LVDFAERIRAGQARNSSTKTNKGAKALEKGTVDTMHDLARAQILGIRRLASQLVQGPIGNQRAPYLHLAALQRLDYDHVWFAHALDVPFWLYIFRHYMIYRFRRNAWKTRKTNHLQGIRDRPHFCENPRWN
jgi:hypothetical protein